MSVQRFEIILDGAPYMVEARPFSFNNETRFRISYNGGGDYVFAYDSQIGRYASVGDDSINIPDNLESAIAQKIDQFKG